MQTPVNALKAALANGDMQRGFWLSTGSDVVAEIAGRAGFDWCLIDGEHAPFDPGLIRRQLVALASTGTQAVVRVPVNEDWVIKQVLDLGAQTLLIPMVNSAAEAQAALAACRFPPDGVRGWGGSTMRAGGYGAIADYAATANDQICVIVQAESQAALDDLDAICGIEGLDGVFIGPADLGADMGYRDNLEAPELWAAINEAIATIRAAGKAAGIIVPAVREAEMTAAGINFIAVGGDTGLLTQTLSALAKGRA